MPIGLLLNGYYDRCLTTQFVLRHRRIRKRKKGPWEGCDELSKEYKSALDAIAYAISDVATEWIHTRFNPETGKIELFRSVCHDVIAEVKISEDENSRIASVRVASELSDCLKPYFRNLPDLMVVFET